MAAQTVLAQTRQELPEDRQFVTSVLAAATAYERTGEFRIATAVLTNAIRTETAGSAQVSELAPLLAELSNVYGRLKDWRNQARTSGRLAELWGNAAGANSTIAAHYLLAQASAHEQDGDLTDASVAERKAIVALEAIYGPHSLAVDAALQACARWEAKLGGRLALTLPDPETAAELPGYEISEHGVTRPEILSRVEPSYSEDARKARHQGRVVMKIGVSPQGKVDQLAIIDPLGLGLDEEAIAAVKKWKFAPGMKDGKPAAVILNVEVNFHLL